MKRMILSIVICAVFFALIFVLMSLISGSGNLQGDALQGLIAGALYGCFDPLIQKWNKEKK